MSYIQLYSKLPKFSNDILTQVLTQNKIEFSIKAIERKRFIKQDETVQDYYLKTETVTEYIDNYINNKYDNKNNYYTNIVSFIINDIEYYLKLSKFNEQDNEYIKTNDSRDFLNVEELKNFFNKQNVTKLEIVMHTEKSIENPKSIIYDYDENGQKLPYSTIIKNEYTNFVFISRTDFFILVPQNTCIPTPNDLYLRTLKKPLIPNYTLFVLNCFYNERIDGVRISSIRDLGRITKTNDDIKKVWIDRLNNLKIAVHAYFKNNFGIDDTDKIFISVKYPEYYKNQSLKFYATYLGDFISSNDMMFYMLRYIHLDDIVEYIKLSKRTKSSILLKKDYSYFTNEKNKKEKGKLQNKNDILYSINITDEKSEKSEDDKNEIITGIENITDEKSKKSDDNNSEIIINLEKTTENNINEINTGIENNKDDSEIIINLENNSHHIQELPENVDISKMNYKKKLLNYEWYFIEIKYNISPDYGYNDVIFYGKNGSKYYRIIIKFKKQNVGSLNNIYNLFSKYYVGFLEFELFLEKCRKKEITRYNKIRYDANFKILLNNSYTTNDIISDYLYRCEIPSIFVTTNKKKVSNSPDFREFNGDNSSKLLSLFFIENTQYKEITELVYSTDDKKLKRTSKMGDSNILDYIARIVFKLDYGSNYKFEMIPTNNYTFNNIMDYYLYFKELFEIVFATNNVIEYVGWFLYDDIFTFKYNVNDLQDKDYIYIKKIHRNIKKAFINYFLILGFNINIILFYHRYSIYPGLHIRVLIIKDLKKFLFEKQVVYTVLNRYLFSYEVENLLELKINFFQENIFFVYEKIEENNRTGNVALKNEIIGGNDNNKNNFKSWIYKYLNIQNIYKIYNLNKIIIDFKIKENKKNISNIKIYDKWIKYKHIMIDIFGIKLKKLYGDIIFNLKYDYSILIKLFLIFKKKTNNVLFIGQIPSNTDYFTISNDYKFNNFDQKYINKKYDIIIINNKMTEFMNSCSYFNRTIVSLLWSIHHINENGIIVIFFRNLMINYNRDLILLLSQFSDIIFEIDYTYSDPTAHSSKVIIKNIKNNNLLINYLEEISKIECYKELSFIEINNIIEGSIEKFNNDINNISNFILKKIFGYMKTFEIDKYNTNYPNISKENEELFLIKSLILFLIQYLYIENPKEDDYYILFELMKKTKTKRILQIGMDNGNWSVFILAFFKFLYYESDELYKLISVDPNQITEYLNMGIDNLKNFNLLKYHKLVDDYSIIYMKKLIDKNKTYDIIFINEWITYDYTLEDLFNSLKVLNIGGYLIIDGILKKNNLKIIEYIDKVFKTLIKINMDNKNIAIYSKT